MNKIVAHRPWSVIHGFWDPKQRDSSRLSWFYRVESSTRIGFKRAQNDKWRWIMLWKCTISEDKKL
ncbi:MAG: hypothetical protein DWI24_01675 [Planctomycetota bacterium]|nr:MAG: hypothetical protein DWI24_01675 [Planctomycetota bacterium]